ncbi:X-linked retinitis pigmentosa GTPase regulator-interacting protein 1-like [Oreochromis aureus]|uniref:X-linked retinitis pigmentosa GTPase regulator-interacting protein 1-like n=1 Tax=Oreochromis aureus TaxID=47969 RepID=UPI001953D57D|nr:X-linked retinitis pigmentosa GTPase regulator-interacting protein 1-like [Oreochromis aureus]XP_039463696.1 X-linked retinitis pigmentosa GTPase regulator-interacting protein 1-like [Oreochromis aureus]
MMSEEETKPAIKEEVEEEEENEEEENEKNRQEVKVEVKKEDESEGAGERQDDDQHELQHGQDTAGQPEQVRTEDMSKRKRLTRKEKIEILLMSGERSSRVIAADFNQRHPERPPIAHSTVSRLLAKFRETGSV